MNGFGACMSAIIAAHDPSIKVLTLGVPDRIIPAAPRLKQLASVGLTPDGIANKVRALLETEVLAG